MKILFYLAIIICFIGITFTSSYPNNELCMYSIFDENLLLNGKSDKHIRNMQIRSWMSQGIANIETAKMAKKWENFKVINLSVATHEMHVKKRFKFRNSTLLV